MTERGVRPLPAAPFSQLPSGLFSLILYLCPSSPFPRFYPSLGPYSKPGSFTESQIPPTTHFCPGHLVFISSPSRPRLLPTPKISLSDPYFTPAHYSNCKSFFNPHFLYLPAPPPTPTALTKKIRPRKISRIITAMRITTTIAHAGNELFSPLSPPAWRPPGKLWVFCWGW